MITINHNVVYLDGHTIAYLIRFTDGWDVVWTDDDLQDKEGCSSREDALMHVLKEIWD